jgi:SAM-dependent methyltransferase
VADYVRYRPSYPAGLLSWLRNETGFAPAWRVADIGSGTGIFSKLLLDNGNHVHAVEPNGAMRAEAEAALGGHLRFTSVNGSAEATTLADHAFDLVTAAQAFHWFEPGAARREFARILKPGGWVLIAFNSRLHDASPWMRAYEDFLRARAVDYPAVDHRRVGTERLRAFFGDYREWRETFTMVKSLDDVIGFSSSSSYTPAPDHPDHERFYAALRELFATHQKSEKVEFRYETEAYLGRLD